MPKGLSLHIGLNAVDPAHYEGWSGPLNACEADAEDMQAIAQGLGYTSTILRTAAATRSAVIDGLKAAAKRLAKGDILFLSYSGHGGQVPDVNGDEPDDLQDETWCLFDGELLDDELYELWRSFAAGVRILVLSDSCHSGTVVKLALSQPSTSTARAALGALGVHDGDVRFRVMPSEVALRTYRKHAAFYDSLQVRKNKKTSRGKKKPAKAVQASVRLVSGCQDNQLSADGTFNGLFTGMLLRVWNKGSFKHDYAAFHKAIVKRMPPTQTPNHYQVGTASAAYDAQQPFSI